MVGGYSSGGRQCSGAGVCQDPAAPSRVPGAGGCEWQGRIGGSQEHNDIDLLFTDVVMPGGLNGRELAHEARQLYPALKVLFTSGYAESAILDMGLLDSMYSC